MGNIVVLLPAVLDEQKQQRILDEILQSMRYTVERTEYSVVRYYGRTVFNSQLSVLCILTDLSSRTAHSTHASTFELPYLYSSSREYRVVLESSDSTETAKFSLLVRACTTVRSDTVATTRSRTVEKGGIADGRAGLARRYTEGE